MIGHFLSKVIWVSFRAVIFKNLPVANNANIVSEIGRQLWLAFRFEIWFQSVAFTQEMVGYSSQNQINSIFCLSETADRTRPAQFYSVRNHLKNIFKVAFTTFVTVLDVICLNVTHLHEQSTPFSIVNSAVWS